MVSWLSLLGISGGKAYGVAPRATLVAVKVIGADGFATTSDILEGLNWVINDVAAQEEKTGKKTRAVINMSLGGPGAVREKLVNYLLYLLNKQHFIK